jgi:hypothetical protein
MPIETHKEVAKQAKQEKLAEKEAAKEAKLAEKEAAKQEKLAEKEAAKQEKLAEKEAVKQKKLAEKEAVKQKKQKSTVAVPARGLAKNIEKDANEKAARQNSLKERCEWALKKPPVLEKKEGATKADQKKEKQENEKKWGNDMIQQTNNGQWTTLLGETLVFDVLEMRGENPRKVVCKNGFKPDWETDDYIYEVKTSNWWVDGTAGEKVYGTWIKYQDIPEIYGKPLRIVCVANQEEELTHGKTQYFGENITKKTQQILDIASSWNIEYVKFSELVSPVLSIINNTPS